jgi:hypothetical protein
MDGVDSGTFNVTLFEKHTHKETEQTAAIKELSAMIQALIERFAELEDIVKRSLPQPRAVRPITPIDESAEELEDNVPYATH